MRVLPVAVVRFKIAVVPRKLLVSAPREAARVNVAAQDVWVPVRADKARPRHPVPSVLPTAERPVQVDGLALAAHLVLVHAELHVAVFLGFACLPRNSWDVRDDGTHLLSDVDARVLFGKGLINNDASSECAHVSIKWQRRLATDGPQ